ncbi:MAG: hypothetical protein CM15mP130_2120 [Verrucomicrobiota bacterium]|nr:MAG: hypothetical protein CM15mP130_2120 [Verrucomicrobiota bacterium]
MIKGRADTRSDFNQTPTLKDWLVKAWSCRPVTLHRFCAPSRNSLLHGMTPSRLR